MRSRLSWKLVLDQFSRTDLGEDFGGFDVLGTKLSGTTLCVKHWPRNQMRASMFFHCLAVSRSLLYSFLKSGLEKNVDNVDWLGSRGGTCRGFMSMMFFDKDSWRISE